MNSLYLILNLGSLSIPLLYSILEKKMHFIQHWKVVFGSISLVAIVFLIWDALFSYYGIWGFNEEYLLGPFFLKMPIEEWLFFWCIPYASLFLHASLCYYFPRWRFSMKFGRAFGLALWTIAFFAVIVFYKNAYTGVNGAVFVIIMGYGLFEKLWLLARFLPSFLIILIPFFIVNGFLTGNWIPEEVVWYHAHHIVGKRLWTIPVEDVFYNFNLLFSSALLIERFGKGRIPGFSNESPR